MASRTIDDIISGRAEGVYGRVVNATLGPLINNWFPTVVVELEDFVGLPPCPCGQRGLHSSALLTMPPCNADDLDRNVGLLLARTASGKLIELAGDVVDQRLPVRTEEGRQLFTSLVSGFVFRGPVARAMLIPSRKMNIDQHCERCPAMPVMH